MTVSFLVREEAEADLAEAYAWYEAQFPNLGDDFLAEVETAFDLIRSHPRLAGRAYKEVRRALIRRFPFAVYYVLENDQIAVLAVMHHARSPERWKSRLA